MKDRPIVNYKGKNYYFSETEENHTLEAVEKNKHGYKITMNFSKDEKENKEAERGIKEFF